MKILAVVFVLCFSIAGAEAKGGGAKNGPLYGKVIIIDPGHGGNDPGASGMHRGKKVVENEYCYDVALRLARLVKASGGLVFFTVRDPNEKNPRNWSPQEVFPDNRNEVFALDGKVVVAGTRGIRKRIAFGNQILRRYPKHRIAWVSIHFDVVGKNMNVEGVRIIATNPTSSLVRGLVGGFADVNRLRDEFPVVENGDPSHGIRRLLVLGLENKVRDKVLIELGNFRNTEDVWRIRNPKVRESYARAIAKGLAKW